MGIDNMNLEQRARNDGRAIDSQWIHENEANEMLNMDPNVSSRLQQMDLDQDILKSVMTESGDAKSTSSSVSSNSNADLMAQQILAMFDAAIDEAEDENEFSHGRSR